MSAVDQSSDLELQRLRQQLRFAAEREDLLSRIDEETRSLVDPVDITLAAATLLGRHLHANRCAFADIEEDQNTFNLFGNFVEGTHSIVGRYTFSDFSEACLRAMRAGHAFVVNDSETDPRLDDVRETFRATATRSVICVPIIKRDVFSAAMAVHSIHPRAWRAEEVHLVFSVASRCWESIERSRLLRDLQTSQERLRLSQIAGNAGTFDWYIPEGRVIWTPELERLYGVPAGTFEGSFDDWTRRVHPDDSARISAEMQGILAAQQREYGYDFRAILPDGSERWLHGQANFLYDRDGTPQRMIGINVDIHERRAAQDALIRSEKLAAVGRLATSIAHEINNPLESVTNLLYLARGTTDPAEIHSLLDIADAELRRMSLITNQTLRFHRQPTSATRITAADLFSGSLAIYRNRLSAAGVRLDERVTAPEPIECFEGEIRQVLNNLIGNALDAMPHGGVLHLRARPAQRGPLHTPGIDLTIADSGSGIPPEHLARIFEPFFTTKGFNGTGLGLWVSHEIIARHGGCLRVRSSTHPQHHGTVFTLFLPLVAIRR